MLASKKNDPELVDSSNSPRIFTFGDRDAPLVLESGKTISPVEIAYETWGSPDENRSNAILILHALSGDAHAAGFYKGEKKPGWWDNMIGPGKAFDTDKYWVICSNVIGGCKGSTGPSSINPSTGEPYALGFPIITIGDMVEAQKRLLDHLGIKKLRSLAGGSMGGFQVLEWTLRYPEMCSSAMLIATSSRVSAQALAFNAVGRHAIISDPGWLGGNFYGTPGPVQGLAVARMIGHITYLSDVSLDAKFGRKLQNNLDYGYSLGTEFAVESYLAYQGKRFTERFDANSYLYITKAIDYFDAARGRGSLNEAFAGKNTRYLVVSYTSDWLFPTEQSKELVRAMVSNRCDVSFVELDSCYGHDSFLVDTEPLKKIIVPFLGNVQI